MKVLMMTLCINLLSLNLSGISSVNFPFYNPLHYECGNRGGTLKEDKNIELSLNYKYKYLFLKLEVDSSMCKNVVSYKIKNPAGVILDEGKIENSNTVFVIEKCYEKQFTGNEPWYIEFNGISKDDNLKFELNYRAKNLKFPYPNEHHENY